jgi:cobalt/nickel transport protein
MKLTTKLWLGILLLALLSPLGLILPEYFKAGSDWTEGSRILWQAPLPEYAFKGSQEKGLLYVSFGYITSAILGIVIIAIAILLIGKKLTRKGNRR